MSVGDGVVRVLYVCYFVFIVIGVFFVEIMEVEIVELMFVGWKKFFVFGGSGYVGIYVCKEVLLKGIFVVSLSRLGRFGVVEFWF